MGKIPILAATVMGAMGLVVSMASANAQISGTYGGASSSMETNDNTSVESLMPYGRHTYMYYPDANVYKSDSGTYYYHTPSGWEKTTTKPSGATLSHGKTVHVNGTAR